MSILGNYFVSEIFAIGDTMPELPYDLVHKAPSDGLWGDTDEDRLGFTYDELEAYIMTGTSGNAEKDKKITRMHANAKHKLTKISKPDLISSEHFGRQQMSVVRGKNQLRVLRIGFRIIEQLNDLLRNQRMHLCV